MWEITIRAQEMTSCARFFIFGKFVLYFKTVRTESSGFCFTK